MTTPKSQSDSDLLLNGSSNSHKDKLSWQNEPIKIAPRGNSDSAQCSSTPVHSSEEFGGIALGSKIEIVRPNIVQKVENTLFTVLTLPTITSIPQIFGETHTGVIAPQYRIASANGESSGFNFDDSTRLPPGYYCLGFVFKSKEEVNSIVSLKLTLNIEPISNFTISQILFELYRSLGFEPSHLLGFTVKPSAQLTPFYRKTRSELGKLEERLLQKSDLSEALIKRLDQLESKFVAPEQKSDLSEALIKRLDQLESKIVAPEQKSDLSDAITKRLDQLESKISIPDQNSDPSEAIIKRLDQLESKIVAPEQKSDLSEVIIKRLDQLESKIVAPEQKSSTDEVQPKSDLSEAIIKRLDQLESKIVVPDQKSDLSEAIIKRLDQLESKIVAPDQTSILEKLSQVESKITFSEEMIKRLEQVEKKGVQPIVPFTPTPIIQKLDQLEKKLPSFDFDAMTRSQKMIVEKLGKLEQTLNEKEDLMGEYQRHVISRDQPEKGTHSVSIDELESIISERNMYLEKLREAEDHIDVLTAKLESAPVSAEPPTHNFRLNSTKGGRK